MITISPFWSLSLDSMPSPNLAHTHFTIYIKTKLFCGRIFQDQARLIVRCALHTLWQKVISASCYLHHHPNIFLMCNPCHLCHLCLLASPFHLMCSFNTNDKRSHGSIPAITPHFFLLRIIPISQKGPHPKRWKFVLWRAKSFALSSSSPHVQDLDSRQLLFARLRKIGIPLPSAATWRMHLKLWLNGCPFRSKFDREALTKLLCFARPALSAHVLHMFAPLALLA